MDEKKKEEFEAKEVLKDYAEEKAVGIKGAIINELIRLLEMAKVKLESMR